MITLKNLCCGYDGIACVKDASLSFKEGKITTVVGTNGCGKSTLLKSCARLIPPLSGEVMLDGKNVAEYAPKEFAKRVSVLSQSRDVPAITVKMLVSHGRFPHMGFMRKYTPADFEMVDYAMELTGISGFAQRDLRSLSGGERQKAYIAMVIAQDTDIVFLDEPTTYLDINKQFELLELIKSLNSHGKTMVMVLHDLSHSLLYSDDIVVISQNRVLMQADPKSVFECGVLEDVFGVNIYRAENKGEKAFYFSKK